MLKMKIVLRNIPFGSNELEVTIYLPRQPFIILDMTPFPYYK